MTPHGWYGTAPPADESVPPAFLYPEICLPDATEDDVKAALKEVKLALLEADVNFKVVKNFIRTVQERAIGSDVMNGLNFCPLICSWSMAAGR